MAVAVVVSVSSVYAGSGDTERDEIYGVLLLITMLVVVVVPEVYGSDGVTEQSIVSPATNPPDRVVVVVLTGVPLMLQV